MARKRKPQITPRTPELSWLDKAIYNMMMVLSPLVGIFLMISVTEWQELAAAAEGALAASNRFWGNALLFLFLCYHVHLFRS